MSDEQFQRAQTCYQQNFEQARSLNSQMNRVPVLAMTLTGGLWFGAGVTENLYPEIRFGLLLFAGFCNIVLVLAALRIRDVFQSYLERIKQFHPDSFASGRPANPRLRRFGNYSMVSIYCTLMGLGAILSFTGAFGFYWPFKCGTLIGILVLILALVLLYFMLFKRNAESGG